MIWQVCLLGEKMADHLKEGISQKIWWHVQVCRHLYICACEEGVGFKIGWGKEVHEWFIYSTIFIEHFLFSTLCLGLTAVRQVRQSQL